MRDQLENVQLEVSLLHCKLDELIRMTNLIHRGVRLAEPLQPTDFEYAKQIAERVLNSTSSDPTFW